MKMRNILMLLGALCAAALVGVHVYNAKKTDTGEELMMRALLGDPQAWFEWKVATFDKNTDSILSQLDMWFVSNGHKEGTELFNRYYDEFKKTAEEGEAWAMAQMADYLYSADASKEKLELALKYAKTASAAGNPLADYVLYKAYSYEMDRKDAVAEKNHEEAQKYLLRSAENGSLFAQSDFLSPYNVTEGEMSSNTPRYWEILFGQIDKFLDMPKRNNIALMNTLTYMTGESVPQEKAEALMKRLSTDPELLNAFKGELYLYYKYKSEDREHAEKMLNEIRKLPYWKEALLSVLSIEKSWGVPSRSKWNEVYLDTKEIIEELAAKGYPKAKVWLAAHEVFGEEYNYVYDEFANAKKISLFLEKTKDSISAIPSFWRMGMAVAAWKSADYETCKFWIAQPRMLDIASQWDVLECLFYMDSDNPYYDPAKADFLLKRGLKYFWRGDFEMNILNGYGSHSWLSPRGGNEKREKLLFKLLDAGLENAKPALLELYASDQEKYDEFVIKYGGAENLDSSQNYSIAKKILGDPLRDWKTAIPYLERAAKKDHGDAMQLLYLVYDGILKDEEKAAELFVKMKAKAKKENYYGVLTISTYELDKYKSLLSALPRNYEGHIKLIEAGAEMGYFYAMQCLWEYYDRKDFKKYKDKIFQLALKGGEMNEINAYNELTKFYDGGGKYGEEYKDDTLAIEVRELRYKAAAESGFKMPDGSWFRDLVETLLSRKNPGHTKRAVELMEKYPDDAWCIYTLSQLYKNGEGVQRDAAKAQELENKIWSASTDSLYKFAESDGFSKEKKEFRAKVLEQISNLPDGAEKYARFLSGEKQNRKAIEVLLPFALENGNCLFDIIKLYRNPVDPADFENSHKLLAKAYSQPEIKYGTWTFVSTLLASDYIYGRGCEKDPSQAVNIINKAIESNQELDVGRRARLTELLAYCYENGLGVERDILRAEKLRETFEKDKSACATVGDMYDGVDYFNPLPVDKLRAIYWYERCDEKYRKQKAEGYRREIYKRESKKDKTARRELLKLAVMERDAYAVINHSEDLIWLGEEDIKEPYAKWLEEVKRLAESGNPKYEEVYADYLFTKGDQRGGFEWRLKSVRHKYPEATMADIESSNTTPLGIKILEDGIGDGSPWHVYGLMYVYGSGSVPGFPKNLDKVFEYAMQIVNSDNMRYNVYETVANYGLDKERLVIIKNAIISNGTWAKGGMYMLMKEGKGMDADEAGAEKFLEELLKKHPDRKADIYADIANAYDGYWPEDASKNTSEKAYKFFKLAYEAGDEGSLSLIKRYEIYGTYRWEWVNDLKKHKEYLQYLRSDEVRKIGNEDSRVAMFGLMDRLKDDADMSSGFVNDMKYAADDFYHRPFAAARLYAMYKDGYLAEQNHEEARRWKDIGEKASYAKFYRALGEFYDNQGKHEEFYKYSLIAARAGSTRAIQDLVPRFRHNKARIEALVDEFGVDAMNERHVQSYIETLIRSGEYDKARDIILKKAGTSEYSQVCLWAIYMCGLGVDADKKQADAWKAKFMEGIDDLEKAKRVLNAAQDVIGSIPREKLLATKEEWHAFIEGMAKNEELKKEYSYYYFYRTLLQTDGYDSEAWVSFMMKAADSGQNAAFSDAIYYCQRKKMIPEGRKYARMYRDYEDKQAKEDPGDYRKYRWNDGDRYLLEFTIGEAVEDKDYALALEILGRNSDVAEAKEILATLYERGLGVEKDLQRAAALKAEVEESLKNPDASAISDRYFYRDDFTMLPKDDARTFKLAKLEYDLKKNAYTYLRCLRDGKGCEKNLKLAFDIAYHDENSMGSSYEILSILEADGSRDGEYMAALWEREVGNSYNSNLACLYLNGFGSLLSDDEIFEYLKRRTNDYSKEYIAYCYDRGIGVEKDHQKANEWRADRIRWAINYQEEYLNHKVDVVPYDEDMGRMWLNIALVDGINDKAKAHAAAMLKKLDAGEFRGPVQKAQIRAKDAAERAARLHEILAAHKNASSQEDELALVRRLLDEKFYEAGIVRLIRLATKGNIEAAKEITKRYSHWGELAEKNDADGLAALGFATLYGMGCDKDELASRKLLVRAFELGNFNVPENTVRRYSNDDPAAEAEWLRKFADEGVADAAYRFAAVYIPNVEAANLKKDFVDEFDKDISPYEIVRSERYLRLAADCGSSDAMMRLSDINRRFAARGSVPIPEIYNVDLYKIFRSDTYMFKNAKKYAEILNDAWSHENLARYYWNGIGAKRDLKKAYEHFKKASEKGRKHLNAYLIDILKLGEFGAPDEQLIKKYQNEITAAGEDAVREAKRISDPRKYLSMEERRNTGDPIVLQRRIETSIRNAPGGITEVYIRNSSDAELEFPSKGTSYGWVGYENQSFEEISALDGISVRVLENGERIYFQPKEKPLKLQPGETLKIASFKRMWSGKGTGRFTSF